VPKTRQAPFRYDPSPLRAAREERGLTREQVATAARCSVAAVATTELGYKRPGPELLAHLCAIVGLTLDDLFVAIDQ
jgi:transcriptional regulator with XRE-family HTH domain